VTYIEADLDSFDPWIEYGLIRLSDYPSNWTEFVRLYGE
jgi:hypothetical protein